MPSLHPLIWLLFVVVVLAAMAVASVRVREGNKRKKAGTREALDTVIAWPPEAVRVISIPEREAFDLLQRAMPTCMVLAQVPLSRFIRVPTRHSYGEWLQRVGTISADLLLCDASSRVLAVIDVRAANETPRARRRHERMARVLKAARINLYTWREAELPGLSDVRNSLSTLLPVVPGPLPASLRQETDRQPLPAATRPSMFDPTMEPVSSSFTDEPDSTLSRL